MNIATNSKYIRKQNLTTSRRGLYHQEDISSLDEMARTYDNGCVGFTRKPATGLVRSFRTNPRNIAAIDFGTTNCSLMYLLNVPQLTEEAKKQPIRLKLDTSGYSVRVPNCALFDLMGNMVAFGHSAQRRYYRNIKKDEIKSYYFFQKIKMKLQHDKGVGRNTIVKSDNGAEFYLVDVIAHILNWLRKELLKAEKGRNMVATDFDWVLTVPAIWRARGKQMMREAGYKAGLCTIKEELRPLHPATTGQPRSVVELHPDKLTLALEPECATAHCRSGGGFQEDENYLLIDIGGGTVDIVSHALVGGNLDELIPPKGNDAGGTTVNESFRKFLMEFLADPNFFRYIGDHVDDNTRIINCRDLEYLVYVTFEQAKRDFGTSCSEKRGFDTFTLTLPVSFWKNYETTLIRKVKSIKDESISVDEGQQELILSRQKMAQFFQPTISRIVDCVKEVLEEVGESIDHIYLAGGFGGCPYLYEKLEDAIQKMTRKYTLHPAHGESELGIVQGACMFRCDPTIIHQRKADATYGVGVSVNFDDSEHDVTKKFWNEDQQKYKCKDIFCTIIEVDDNVCSDSVYVTDINVGRKDLSSITLCVYSSLDKNVWYTTSDRVSFLGRCEVHVSGVGLGRQIEIAVDFTHAEIQLRAHDKKNPKNEAKITLDFLCMKE